MSTVSLAAIVATPAIAAQQTKSDKSPPQALKTEQEVKSGANACGVTNGQPLPANCTPTNTNAITVTGTRIRRPNLESPLPVTSIGGEEFFQTGNVSVGDKLADLPSIRSTFTQANSTRFLGTAGLNLLDLRGLGTARTLVLVNGRRHVGGDVLSSGVAVDVNTIPTDLIDRVDVVTGGNSAVYGSDAIAGVVNFILKDHYQGIQLRGQGGISRYGDAGSYFVSGLVGKNFAGGRGNVAVNLEWARQEQAWGSDRPWLAQQNGFIQVENDAVGLPNGSDNVPDRLFFNNINSASFANTGLVRFGGTILSGTGAGTPSNLTCGSVAGATGSSAFYNCPYIFNSSGQLVPITGTRVGLGPTGSFIGGNGENFRTGDALQLRPKLDRYNINLIGHFDISPALVPFVEAKFSRTDSVGTGGSGPAFISGTTDADPLQFLFGSAGGTRSTNPGNREAIALNNPYLDPATRTFITNQILASGVNNCTFSKLTATDMARITAGTFRFCDRVNMTGLGNRVEEARRDTYRIVAGFKGDFADNFHYELSGNYGRLNEKTKILGNLDVQRFLLAMDAVRDPTTGNIVCASQINPSRAFGYYPWFYYQYYGASYPGADPNAKARLANDVAKCTPVNPLGGQFTDAQKAYLLKNTTSKGSTSQLDFTGFISGDTGKFLNLWGGPIGLVLGAEYREENLKFEEDPDVALGYTFYNAIPTFKAPRQKVTEGFGEISIPIVKDRPFLRELEIDGAARVSHYTLGKTGTVWAYNVNGIYSPVEGVRFRGNYARAVRAPNQSELFSPAGQNFAPGFTDPCSAINLSSGSQFRSANCTAAGRPAGYDFRYSQSLGFKSGGNPNLKAETSDSWTFGGVLQPRFVPGFSASVDYYNIKLKNAIAFVGAQTVANACYDQPTFPNVFCGQFQRAGASGGPHGEEPFQIIEGSLLAAPLNYAKLTARGIDTEITYRHQIGTLGRLDTRFTYTHVIDRSNYTSATDPNFKTVQLLTLGDPQDAFNWNTSLTHGRFTLGYQMRYLGKQVLNAYEDTFSSQGRPPQNADYADRRFYPSVFYHDVRLGIDVGPKYNFYMGVDNLTDAKPPLGLTGIGGGSGIYDNRGRFYYTGVVAKF
ncbi:MAG: TonB-dependent receptor domain-containing protein [Sphingomicrobium sp.]